MKRISLLTLAVCLLASTALADLDGAWTAQTDDRRDKNSIHLMTTRHPFGNWGMSHELSDLTGLTRAQIDSESTTPVKFELRRDAGTVTFEGTFRKGFGAGQLTFAPNRGYFSSIRALGIALDLQKSEEEELFRFAMFDLSVGYAREMHAIYPDSNLRELSKLRAVDVTPAWLREMRGAGVEIKSAHEAKKLAAMGVSAKFVRELASAGYTNLSVRDLTRLAAVGVDGDFIREMSKYREK